LNILRTICNYNLVIIADLLFVPVHLFLKYTCCSDNSFLVYFSFSS